MPRQRAGSFLPTLILITIGVCALWMRTWRLHSIPPGFHLDEAFEGLEAWRILTDPHYRPLFLTGNFGVPPLNAYVNAATFSLFQSVGQPIGPFAMRLTAALCGILGVVALYALAREFTQFGAPHLSSAYPFFAAAVLATMRWHVHFSRMGIEPIFVPLLWTLVSWTFLRGWRTGRWLDFAGCGIFLALGMYAYQGAWVIPFLLIPVSLHLILAQAKRPARSRLETVRRPSIIHGAHSLRTWSKPRAFLTARIGPWLGITITAMVALLLFAPLGWFFMQNPEWLLLRPTQLAIVGETNSPADATLWQNVWATARMFGPFGAPGDLDPRRNLPGAPVLSPWLAVPFYAGCVLAIRRLAHPVYAITLIGLVGLLLPGIFSEYAPHFHRVLGAAAPTALLCAVGLDALWQWQPARRYGLHGVSIALVMLGVVTAGWNYFGRWATLPDLFYAFDAGLWDAGQWIAAQPADTPIFLTPRESDHPTLAFAWRTRREGTAPISFDGRHIFPITNQMHAEREAYMVIEHEDFRTPQLLPGVLPDATVVYTIRDDAGTIYARAFERPPGAAPQRPPQHPLDVTVGDGIVLVGYDVQPARPQAGSILYLQLHWLTTALPSTDWTVFTHVVQIKSDGTEILVAGFDSPPGANTLPTTRWRTGWRILDEYQIPLPTDLAAGEYILRAGMYQQTDAGFQMLGAPIELGLVAIAP